MFRKNLKVALATMTALFAWAPLAHAATDPTGIWLNDTGRGAIEIKKCGKRLCGHVVWVKAKKDRKGCGEQIIGGVRKVGKRTWDKGWIYSPEKGKKFSVELTTLKNGRLQVMGYAGSKFFSKTMIWKRAPADLVLCNSTQIEAKAKTQSKKKAPSQAKADRAPKAVEKDVAAATTDKAVDPAPAKRNSKKRFNDDVADTSPDDELVDDASEEDVAKAQPEDEADDDEGDFSSGEPSIGDFKLGDLKVEKYFKRTKSGRCNLDTPWIKIDFDCN